MVRYTVILFVPLMVLNALSIQVTDIFRIKELIEHAQFHRQTYGDDFFTFLSKHYGTAKSEHRDNPLHDSEHHDKLPFQHLGSSFGSFFIPLTQDIALVFHEPVPVQQVIIPYCNQYWPAQYIEELLHPPQV